LLTGGYITKDRELVLQVQNFEGKLILAVIQA